MFVKSCLQIRPAMMGFKKEIPVNTRDFKYFMMLTETMNFNKAAEKLFITQQALSAHIQKMEREYSVRLFERKPRLMLTPAGRCLLRYGRQALQLESELTASLADISDTATGQLNVGIHGVRGSIFMPHIWKIFRSHYPNISLSLIDERNSKLEDMLLKGLIDIHMGIWVSTSPGLRAIRLAQERMYCMFTRTLAERQLGAGWRELLLPSVQKGGIDLSVLKDFPFIAFPPSSHLRTVLDRAFERIRLIPNVIIETTRHDIIYRLCHEGFGAGIMHGMILWDNLQKSRDVDDVVILPIAGEILMNYLVYREEVYHPAYFDGFIEAARTVFQDYSATASALMPTGWLCDSR